MTATSRSTADVAAGANGSVELRPYCEGIANAVDSELEARRYPADFRGRVRTSTSLFLASETHAEICRTHKRSRAEALEAAKPQVIAAALAEAAALLAEDLRWRIHDQLAQHGREDQTDQAVGLVKDEKYSLPDGRERTPELIVETIVAAILAS